MHKNQNSEPVNVKIGRFQDSTAMQNNFGTAFLKIIEHVSDFT